MSLGFKRVISSIMAFVMMVSTLVMVNVTGVIAADKTLNFADSTVTTTLGVSNGKTNVTAETLIDVGNGFGVWLNSANRDCTDGYLQFGSNSDYIQVTSTTAGATLTLSVSGNSNNSNPRSITINGATDTSSDVVISGTTPVTKTYTLGAAGTYNLASAQNVRFYTVTVTENENTSVKSIEAANTENYAGEFTFVPSTIDSSAAQPTDTITVSYAGDDYYMDDATITVDDLTEGDNYTYDVSKLALTPKTYDITATGYPGMAGVFNYTASTDVAYGTEVTISYTGDDYTMEPQTINTNAIDPSYMTVGGTGADCTLTVDSVPSMGAI